MIPIGAIKYILTAAIFVVCVFLGTRMIFAGDPRREDWRSWVKRRFYLSQRVFKIVTIVMGVVLLAIGLYVGYVQIDKLMAE